MELHETGIESRKQFEVPGTEGCIGLLIDINQCTRSTAFVSCGAWADSNAAVIERNGVNGYGGAGSAPEIALRFDRDGDALDAAQPSLAAADGRTTYQQLLVSRACTTRDGQKGLVESLLTREHMHMCKSAPLVHKTPTKGRGRSALGSDSFSDSQDAALAGADSEHAEALEACRGRKPRIVIGSAAVAVSGSCRVNSMSFVAVFPTDTSLY